MYGEGKSIFMMYTVVRLQIKFSYNNSLICEMKRLTFNIRGRNVFFYEFDVGTWVQLERN